MIQERRLSDAPRIAHVGIAVSDLAAASAFYREVLGKAGYQERESMTFRRDSDQIRVHIESRDGGSAVSAIRQTGVE